jgi:hypothetical protein
VRGAEFERAIDRLTKIGVINGRETNLYVPNAPTRRVEYAIMTMKGLNLRDVRDLAAIKFVLAHRSKVTLDVRDNRGKSVATLINGMWYNPGEHTEVWDGRSGTGYVAPGRYTYVCTAKNTRGETTTLRGSLRVVPQTPLQPAGKPSFVDVAPAAWYYSYLAIAEKQDLVRGYPDRTFRPMNPISRVEATAIVVRAVGLEDLARRVQNKDVGFLDYQDIPRWAVGYVNVASVIAKTTGGKAIVRGYPSNFFFPNKLLQRDEAALIVERLIDQQTNRRLHVSGQLAPGATVTINNQTVKAKDDGQFSFVLEQTGEPMTIAVLR